MERDFVAPEMHNIKPGGTIEQTDSYTDREGSGLDE